MANDLFEMKNVLQGLAKTVEQNEWKARQHLTLLGEEIEHLHKRALTRENSHQWVAIDTSLTGEQGPFDLFKQLGFVASSFQVFSLGGAASLSVRINSEAYPITFDINQGMTQEFIKHIHVTANTPATGIALIRFGGYLGDD